MNLKIKTKFVLVLLSFMMLMCGMISNPLQAKAATVTTTSITFDEHKGMVVHIDGAGDAYCIQRGYPFRTRVSDLQSMYTTYEGETITLAEWVRQNLSYVAPEDGKQVRFHFVGWGLWELNDDHTGATNVTTDLSTVPSSGAWQEEFDEETVDGEDAYVNVNGNTERFDWYQVTGHEGSKEPYDTEVKQIENTLSQSRLNALAMANYYIFEDPDVSGIKLYAKRQVASTLSWAAEFGFLDSIGTSGRDITVTFNTATGKYKSNDSMTSGTMSCDEFVKLYIGSQYDAMKLYRHFVWAVTNMRTIPSFSYDTADVAKANPIKLRWDESENAYIATINDENGVLDYFKFSLSGITVTDNGDGTLTLKSAKPINGTITSDASASTLLPSDCKFTLPTTYRWKLEGTSQTFTYTTAVADAEGWGWLPWGGWGQLFNHSLDYAPRCKWHCYNSDYEEQYCDGELNDGWVDGHYTKHTHDADCAWGLDCSGDYNDGWVPGQNTEHTCDSDCSHYYNCPYAGEKNITTEKPTDTCKVRFYCDKDHYKLQTDNTVTASYGNYQDIIEWDGGEYLIDPVYAYISVVTEDPHVYESETSAEVQLIDQDGNVVDHIKVGEIYKVRYIFTYEGASKGFKINEASINKTYYSFPYTTRMTTNNSIESLKDSYAAGVAYAPHAQLYIDETNVTMRGYYMLAQQTDGSTLTYPSNNYFFDSEETWNDTIYLDALKTEVTDDNYTNKSATAIKNSSDHKGNVKVTKTSDDNLKIVWTFDTEYEVFTSAYINISSYISVGENDNYSKDYFEAKFNYGETENHNWVGGDGYFNRHTIITRNSEYPTYAVKNKVYQSDIDLSVDNVVLNTGAGITQPIYQKVGTSYHDINYNLYYTLKLTHPYAYTYERTITKANNKDTVYSTPVEKKINISNEVYEFDVNTKIDFSISGDNLETQNLSFVSVDHIKSNTNIHIQKAIPSRIATITNGKTISADKASVKVTANYGRTLYEDDYVRPTVKNSTTVLASTLSSTINSNMYIKNNTLRANDKIYTAMNPNTLRPTTIKNSNNVNKTKYSSSTPTTFNIKLANGKSASVVDSNTKAYKLYSFVFNTGKKANQITFPSYRKSASMFKYSSTKYTYNGKTVNAATGTYSETNKTQTERYYISEVLFKSNYTSKNNLGANKDGWVDMVNDNKNAIVTAGQGFELQVTVKYENTLLTQYLTRYIKDSGYTGDDGQSTSVGSSAYKTPQYGNISPLTVGYNESGSKVGYLSGFKTTDRLFAKMLQSVTYKVMTGSNVYADLYAYMSDNKDTVYSYSGIYDTPVIFERKISYSSDFSVVTIVYTMKQSTENGVTSSFQKMKFYTNSLASNSITAGIITNNKDVQVSKQHSITLWTPIINATGFDYPDTINSRYLGDAIEIGYTITTSTDSITHIVQ